MKKTVFSLLLWGLTIGAVSAQATLVEKVTKKGSALIIPYEKYRLPNGLTVLVHEDHSDPLIHVDVTYHVGSAREQIGKSGFAHFFEHMMFQGSDHVSNGGHFKLVTEAGGKLNGSTNRDRTNYFETVPSNQLERVLWLEADRMGFLLDAVTQQKFEIQRATVKNERGQNYDNRPYGLASEYTAKTLYPYGHPYSWLTIGYVDDLNRVNVNDLKDFFLRWYGPNNAVLTVGGDVTANEVIRLAETYFGSIPKGPAVERTTVSAAVLTANRYVSYEDNVRFPMLQITYPTVPAYHADELALDALADILGGGQKSLFYKTFVKTQKAVQAGVGHPTSELAGELTLSILPLPSVSLDSTQQAVERLLASFDARGVTDDELQGFKATREASILEGLSSVASKVTQLTNYQTFLGNPNRLPQEMNRLANLTTADIMRVYRQYIKGKSAVILTVYPKGKKELVVHPDNYTPATAGYQAPDYGYKGLVYNKPKDAFDRFLMPRTGPNPAVQVPPYWTNSFSNGMKIIGTKYSEAPTVTLLLNFKGGHQLSQHDLSKAGIAQLTATLMNEATQRYTAEALSTQLEKLGSTISVYAGAEEIGVSVETSTKNLNATLALLEEKLLHPRFAAGDFARRKNQQLELIANQNTQPVVMANKAFTQLLFGNASIRAIPIIGTHQSVSTITLEDVKNFYSQYLSPSAAKLVIVGDVSQQDILSKLAFLKKWAAKPVDQPTLMTARPIDKTRIYLLDKPGAPQSEIRIGYLTDMPFDATGDYYRSGIANFMLGGAFNSHLNMNLREAKGYTYAAQSSFKSSHLPGPFTAQAGVKGSVTDSSVVEFMKDITRYAQQGIDDSELAFTKSSIGQRDALRYETPFQKANFLSNVLDYDLPQNFVEQQATILKNITREQINAIAHQRLPVDKMIILVVGDKARVKPGLSRLGYELIELDKDGSPLASQN